MNKLFVEERRGEERRGEERRGEERRGEERRGEERRGEGMGRDGMGWDDSTCQTCSKSLWQELNSHAFQILVPSYPATRKVLFRSPK